MSKEYYKSYNWKSDFNELEELVKSNENVIGNWDGEIVDIYQGGIFIIFSDDRHIVNNQEDMARYKLSYLKP